VSWFDRLTTNGDELNSNGDGPKSNAVRSVQMPGSSRVRGHSVPTLRLFALLTAWRWLQRNKATSQQYTKYPTNDRLAVAGA